MQEIITRGLDGLLSAGREVSLASSVTPTATELATSGSNPGELLVLAAALLLGGGMAGLLVRMNRA